MNVSSIITEPANGSATKMPRQDQAQLAELRIAAEQLVSITFFQTLLQTAHNSSMKGKYGHGGRGEEVFTAQLDGLLAERSTASSGFKLVDEIYERLARRYMPGVADNDIAEVVRPSVNILG